MQKKEAPLLRGKEQINKDVVVYKSLLKKGGERSIKKQPKPFEISKEVIKAGKIIFDRLWESMAQERDLSRETLPFVGSIKGRYTNDYTSPEDGWVVSKLLFPDNAAGAGKGYHRVAIVASTAETAAGVDEALKRAYQTKTKLEQGTSAHITGDTVIVLSSNIDFKLANELRRMFSNEQRTVFIYSVKNAIGVAKNAIKAFATLFTTRAQKILALPRLKEEMQILAETLRKRSEKLFRTVTNLSKLLERIILPKRELKKAKDAAYKYLSKAREWGLSIWVENEEFGDLDALYNKIMYKAQLQNIDLDAMQQSEIELNAKRILNRVNPG